MAKMLYQGHGSYRFTLEDGTVVYVDPFAGEGYGLAANLILVTHEHFDHNQVNKMPHATDCEIIRAADLHPVADAYLSTTSHGVLVTALDEYLETHKCYPRRIIGEVEKRSLADIVAQERWEEMQMAAYENNS